MKKVLWLTLLVASSLLIVLAVSSRESKVREGTVTVEQLACHQMDQKLVCLDGEPVEAIECRDLGDNTVLCSPKS